MARGDDTSSTDGFAPIGTQPGQTERGITPPSKRIASSAFPGAGCFRGPRSAPQLCVHPDKGPGSVRLEEPDDRIEGPYLTQTPCSWFLAHLERETWRRSVAVRDGALAQQQPDGNRALDHLALVGLVQGHANKLRLQVPGIKNNRRGRADRQIR